MSKKKALFPLFRRITIVDGFDESSIVDKRYLCHTASEIIVESGDEVPCISCALYVIKFSFSANIEINKIYIKVLVL